MKKLLLASNNQGKLEEIRALLADVDVALVTPDQIGLKLEVDESGHTYAENAALKARVFAGEAGLLSMADDSGLEVDALDGAPGLHSARYAPHTGATDAHRRAYLLENLAGKPRPWRAHFRCVIAIVTPFDGQLHYAEGACGGEIIPQERGRGGFGYDPIFLLPDYGRTMAELEMQEKNRISHRARAVQAAKPILLELLAKLF